MKTQEALNIDGKTIAVSNLDKIFWPSPVITKADLIKYYAAVAPVALKHWSSRPLTLQRYPNGIEGEGFYQKNAQIMLLNGSDGFQKSPIPRP